MSTKRPNREWAMKPKQIDIFGNEHEVEETIKSVNGGRRRKRMQELYGVIEGKTCKTCTHCVKYVYGYKHWYKCEEWVVTSCAATDIRLKDKACGKYAEVEE